MYGACTYYITHYIFYTRVNGTVARTGWEKKASGESEGDGIALRGRSDLCARRIYYKRFPGKFAL